ncbi:MAG: hypothetical protein PWR13_1306 [Archaeoglobi archaeon]|nr:hypothetical protein [Archaeoglobi archaeon]MDK2782278.1 hypothetical protein [Archaeoglobi archaeon]
MSSKINFLLPGVLMVLLGAIIWSFGIHLLGSGLVLGGIVSLIVQSINLSKPESERILDERIERINEKAGFHAFWSEL